MALNVKCFRDCMRKKMNWQTWLIWGLIVVAMFILCFVTYGMALGVALAIAAAAGGLNALAAMVDCYNKC